MDDILYNSWNEFNFYQLDPENKNWSYLGQNEPKANGRKAVQMEKFKDDNLINFNINYSAHPELKPFNNIKWIYSGKSKKFDPFKNKWVFMMLFVFFFSKMSGESALAQL